MSFFNFTLEQLKAIKFKDFFKRLYTKAFDEEDVTSNAAQVAFYFMFALFPLLLFLVSIFGIVIGSADDLKAEMFQYLQQAMPASAFDLVKNTIQEVSQSSSGGKLTFGILVALYSASAGVDSIRIVLNGVYNLTETRPFWKTKLTSFLVTLGLGVLVTLALGIILYGSKFTMLLLNSLHLPIQSPIILGVLQFIIVGIVLILIFGLLYNFLPNHKEQKWVWVTPGSIAGIVLWLLLSFGFRTYLGYFNSYDKTYGSLGAVIILMLWLYLTALVILIGGTINAVLQEFTDPETAEAGANKAAAKETIENPDKAHDANAGKKAEVMAAIGKGSEKDAKNVKTKNEDSTVEAKPKVEKSKLKLIAGLIIGFFTRTTKR